MPVTNHSIMAQTFVSNHPYYPVDVEIPLYMPNASSVVVLLASFSSIIGITLLLTLVISKRINPDVSISEQALICWFGLCEFADDVVKHPANRLRWLFTLFLRR